MAAVQRILALVTGKITEYIPLTASAGAASAGQVIATNSAGTLDVTLLPSGVGPDTQSLTASEAISAGAYVNIYSNAGAFAVRNADGSTTGKEADGFVLAAVASGGQATVYLSGINNAVTGQVPGLVFLSDTSVGAGATNGATTPGHTYQQLGLAISATAVQFDPQLPIIRS